MENNRISVSVIILSWNSEKYIRQCINSLFIDLNFYNMEKEIIIVDNGSSDRTIKILKQLHKKYSNMKVIELEKNLGTTISRNIGIRESLGKYIFILDSDTEVQEGTISTLIDMFNKKGNIGIVAPRLYYSDGSIQPSCKKFPTIKTKIYKYIPFNITRKIAKKSELYNNIYEKEYKKITEVDYCISAAWMVNREAINDIGLFDENIFYAPEDVDYCLRMWLKGWKVIYTPMASVIHHTQRKSYKDFNIAWQHLKGLLYYFGKYNYWFNRKKIYKRIKNR
ncbi:glycosyltransferase family 2 protein [Candidatus Atribacteria bacterium HGW-Atribacteria-1]|nr:MAG: glycosyltransferase family 2 protein [Candidatus Atribacteria bacterium HGW-Atribacteria-1]